MSRNKLCFVVMPFGAPGSEAFQRNRKVLDEFIRPTVSASGYEVRRADDIAEPGSITRDVIEWLHKADLVIADLTGHNANVFYELGVRHALRRSGTIPIVEAGGKIPFDLSTYRAIHYELSDGGLSKFRDEVSKHIASFENVPRSDNPVHDVLQQKINSELPALNAIEIGQVEMGVTDTVWVILLANDFHHLSLDQFKAATVFNLRKGVRYRFVIPDTPQCRRAIRSHAQQCLAGATPEKAALGTCEYRLLPSQQMGILVPSVFFDIYKANGSGYIRNYQGGKYQWLPFDHDRLWQAVEGFEHLWEQGEKTV